MITLVGGHIQRIDSSALPNGSIVFQLNMDATVAAAPGGFVPGATDIVFQFDASGNIQSGAQIYSNSELQPQNSLGLGTYYLVTVFDANGSRLNATPMAWQFTESTGTTVDISQMVPIATVRGTIIYYPSPNSGSGTVTSVGLQGDGVVFNSAVSGSPITSSGTFVLALLSHPAGTFFAGPSTGPSAPPSFRNIVNSDFPTSGVTAGSYTSANITVNAQGIVTAAANGSGGFTNPMTTLGDTMYENATPTAARLPGNTTTTKQFLTQTGTGTISAAPVWGTIAVGDLPTTGTWAFAGTLSGNPTFSGTPIFSNVPTFPNQSANTIFAGPTTGAAATPTFRATVVADLPTTGTWAFAGTISGNMTFSGNPEFSGEILDGTASHGTANQVLSSTGTGVQWVTPGGGSLSDAIDVNGAQVAAASITALVNGAGPVGEVETNGFLAQNNTPCLLENTSVNLAQGLRVLGTVYQNPYNVPILVEATFLTSSATTSTFTGFSDSNASPSTVVYKENSPNVQSFVTVTMFVLPNQFYKITSSAGTPTVQAWRESRLMTGTFADSGEIHASRSLTTVFQNTTGKLMFVVAQVGSVNSASSVQGISDTQPTPQDVIDDATHSAGTASTTTVFMPVPPGHYYKVTAASGSLSLWHEYTWTVPVTKSINLGLTTGYGQTRTVNGFTQPVSIGGTASTVNEVQSWHNGTFRVRWIQIVYSNTSTSGSCIFRGGEGIPVLLATMICSQNAAINRAVYGPILPWKFYTIFDNSSGTITPVSWFEYQLG